MDKKTYIKAQSLKRDMERIDMLYTVASDSIFKFDDKKHEENRMAVAKVAIRDLLFTEQTTLFKRNFLDFLAEEAEKYEKEFEGL